MRCRIATVKEACGRACSMDKQRDCRPFRFNGDLRATQGIKVAYFRQEDPDSPTGNEYGILDVRCTTNTRPLVVRWTCHFGGTAVVLSAGGDIENVRVRR